ncbi:NAD(P)-dependent alcohol dehydrogenase [Glycomyces tenuis]|uniref:NAD(P)-dependent alcohol dehydrogenase n=1 Tax=Glycomyces tenuis TaxID=58116 RepID=UPI000410C995|nr:NAD(P)-dependent alcohol dehydrogenase [Glycomyces tenuis]
MKAVVHHRYGAPEQVLALTDIERPEPGPGQVLVRVKATGVNTPDWIAVTGTPYLLRARAGEMRRGAVRGTDLAGTVEAVGDDVTDLRPGQDVFGSAWTGGMTTTGTFAEYALAPAAQLIGKPAALSFETAAASVMSGLTALHAWRATTPVHDGMRVLVNGASGGVGTFAVQIAAHDGAHVTGVCGPGNLDLVRSLGAAAAIDHTTDDFTAGTERYDAILDNVLNHPPSRTIRALAEGGVLMPNSVGNTGGLLAGLGRMARANLLGRLRRADVRFVTTEYHREALTALARLLESGAIRAVVDHAYPLEETPKAVAHMLSHRASGNIVITVP